VEVGTCKVKGNGGRNERPEHVNPFRRCA
jgi:hypothetical protein